MSASVQPSAGTSPSPSSARPVVPAPVMAAVPASIRQPDRDAAVLARVARGSAANLVGAVVSAVCSFALAVVITRGMSRIDAGVFFSVTSLFLVATSVGQLGTDTGLVYFLSRARRFGHEELVRHYLRAAARPVMITALIMSVGMFVLAGPLGSLTNPDHGTIAARYLRILALFILPSGLETLLLSATRGLGTMRPNVAVEQIGRQGVQLLMVASAVAVAGTTWLALAWSLPYLVAVTMAWTWWRALRRRTVDPEAETRLARSYVLGEVGRTEKLSRDFWRFTMPRSFASVAQLLMQRIDIVLVGALAGPVEAAIFTAATRFIVAGQFGRSAVSLAVQPSLAVALADDDDLGLARRLFQTSAAWLIGVTWPLYLTFCVSGHEVLAVFGRGYGEGTTILLLVSLGMLVATGCGDVDSALIMAGRTTASLTNMTLALAVMIGLDLWLIPGHGAVGAAIGWGVAVAVKNTAALIRVWSSYRLNPFGRATVIVLALNLVCFVVVQYAAEQVPAPWWGQLGAGLAVSVLAYVAGGWLLRDQLQLGSFASLRRRDPAARSRAADV